MSEIICKAVSRKLFGGEVAEVWQFVKMQKSNGKWTGNTLGDPNAYYMTPQEACDAYREYLENNDMHKSSDWLDFYERKGENVKVKLGEDNR